MKLNAQSTAAVVIDMHRGHLDPAVATLPLPAERCRPLIDRAAALFRSLRQAGVEVTLRTLPGADHGGDKRFSSQERLDEIVAFLDRHLRRH